MPVLKRMVLDVLKPHHPGILEFANALVDRNPGCTIDVSVEERDEKTESVTVVVEGAGIDFELVSDAIGTMGASIHSIDEVTVEGDDG